MSLRFVLNNGPEQSAWNPEYDYGDDDYVRVHFRMETNGYHYPDFRFADGILESFDVFCETVMEKLHWEKKSEHRNGSCMEIVNGLERLYLHPMDFAGIVLKNSVKEIARVLLECGSEDVSIVYNVDIYDTLKAYTDEEYDRLLQMSRKPLSDSLLRHAATTRRTTFVSCSEVVRLVCGEFEKKFPRHGADSTQLRNYVNELCRDLKKAGLIIEMQPIGGRTGLTRYVRSANKTEQRLLGFTA